MRADFHWPYLKHFFLRAYPKFGASSMDSQAKPGASLEEKRANTPCPCHCIEIMSESQFLKQDGFTSESPYLHVSAFKGLYITLDV
jgi:hypothetical protein